MKRYFRVYPGQGSMYAAECFKGNFIGVDYGFKLDLGQELPENWRDFNKKFIPVFMANNPGKTKVAAGLACGMTWSLCKGYQKGDVMLMPNGEGVYLVGELTGDYMYQPNSNLPHRRPVHWFQTVIEKNQMSEAFWNTAISASTVCEASGYADEIEKFISGQAGPVLRTTDETVEDPYAFAMEQHLEDFLVKNWAHVDFGKDYKIYEENGALTGRQFPTDIGPIDILAVSKNKKSLLVIELKRGRISDVVVGQTLRYMGYVQEQLAEDGQEVKGAIIALEDDLKLRYSLKMVPSIGFYFYQISFKLIKA